MHNPADHGGLDATCGPIKFSYAITNGDSSNVTIANIPTITPCPITAPKAAPGAPATITTLAQIRGGKSIKPQAITIQWTGSSTVTDPSDGFDGSPASFTFTLILHVGSKAPKSSMSDAEFGESAVGVDERAAATGRSTRAGTVGGGGGGAVIGTDFFTVAPIDGSTTACTCNQEQISNAAKKYHVDPFFIAAIASRESGGDSNCNSQDPLGYGSKSPKFGQHQDGHGYGVMGIDDRWHTSAEGDWKRDAQANIDVGTSQLARLLKKYGGSQLKAAHDYNAGNPFNQSNPADYDSIVGKNSQRLAANRFFRCEQKGGPQAFARVLGQVIAYVTRQTTGSAQEAACSSRAS